MGRAVKVDREAFLPSEDKAVTAVWRLSVLVLSFREMVVQVDKAGKAVQAVGVV